MNKILHLLAIPTTFIVGFSTISNADERPFTYVYEAEVLPEGEVEIEQWITNQSKREEGDYSAWNFRTELEFGVTNQYQTALYLNFDSIRSENMPDKEDVHDTDFKGISWENTYQLLNPNLDSVGLATYLEYTTDALDHELEGKLLLSKPLGDFILAANAVYEAEWEKEDGSYEKEASLQFVGGVSYKLSPKWSTGIEFRNKSAYPDGLNLSGQEYQTWSVGPNIHYGNSRWFGTLTILPQVWGNGDGSNNNRQLAHEESVEVRLIIGALL